MLFGGMFEEPKRNRPKFTRKDKEPHYKFQNGRCNGCKKKFDIENLTVDHIKSFESGGGEKIGNIQLLCEHCNSLKGKGTMKQLEKKLIAQGTIKSPAETTAKKAAPTKTKATTTTKKAATTKKASAKSTGKKKPTRRNADPFEDLFTF